MLGGRNRNAAITQHKVGIPEAWLSANLRFSPKPEPIAMLGQQPADEREPCLILRQVSFGILFDLYDFLVRPPNHQNIRCVPASRAFMMVFEDKWLLLPRISTRRGHQNLKRFQFILRFSVA
jgi:hypothetical protein